MNVNFSGLSDTPTIFEIMGKSKMDSLIYPVFMEYVKSNLKFVLFKSTLEYFYFLNNFSSFTESFYGLIRRPKTKFHLLVGWVELVLAPMLSTVLG